MTPTSSPSAREDSGATRATLADDGIAPFSSRGSATRGPDVVAPGVAILSTRVPGSFLDEAFPAARIGDGFRGSGTSQAAAVVSGAAALLVGERPTLDPDQVKALLRAGARPLPDTDTVAPGRRRHRRRRRRGRHAPAPRASRSASRTPASAAGCAARSRNQFAVENLKGSPLDRHRWGAHRWTALALDRHRWTGSPLDRATAGPARAGPATAGRLGWSSVDAGGGSDEWT